jgi:hypothetical protein
MEPDSPFEEPVPLRREGRGDVNTEVKTNMEPDSSFEGGRGDVNAERKTIR